MKNDEDKVKMIGRNAMYEERREVSVDESDHEICTRFAAKSTGEWEGGRQVMPCEGRSDSFEIDAFPSFPVANARGTIRLGLL